MVDRLQCVVRDYAWGHPTFIPELLGQPSGGEPQAELWMGAHPSAPSQVDGIGLDRRIYADPSGLLGSEIDDRFGGLPLLFKVLAANVPLSIQAHPSLEQAKVGFARENDAGIPLDASNRTYRDDNHKPELICALTTFEAKCGFRPVAETQAILARLQRPELDPLLALLAYEGPEAERPGDAERIEAAISYLLGLDPASAGPLVNAVVEGASALVVGAEGEPATDLAGLHELRWTTRLAEEFGPDIGVVVALFLNHVELQPGEALFLPAGNLHAYLSGAGMELMANSDNVVRGGLTPKHIDVGELLAVLDFSPIEVPVQRPAGPVHTFDCPVPEFSLTRVDLSAGGGAVVTGPAIVVLTEGQIELPTVGAVDKGQPLFVAAADTPLAIRGDDGLAWIASVTPGQVAGSARL